MSTEITQFEARAYKRLYEMYKATLLKIINKASNCVFYHSDDKEEIKKLMTYISDEKHWDYSGIENAVDTKIIDELEKCLQP